MPEYNISELQEKFDDRGLTAVELCEAFLQRLEEIDRAGPTLGAVIAGPDRAQSPGSRAIPHWEAPDTRTTRTMNIIKMEPGRLAAAPER